MLLQSQEMTTDLLTPAEVAELLHVTEKRLINWRYQGVGPKFVRLGHRTVRYSQADLEAWLADHLVEPGESR